MNFFDDFENIIERELKALRRIFQKSRLPDKLPNQPEASDQEGIRTFRWGPIIYGRSTTIGPDGEVQTREWSNLTPEAQKELEEQFKDSSFSHTAPPQPRRPSPIPDPLPPWQPFPVPQPEPNLDKPEEFLVDLIDTKDGFVAIFDTPATSTHDVEARVEEQQLQLWIQGKLFRELELPVPVELTSLHFKNGVVELRLSTKKVVA